MGRKANEDVKREAEGRGAGVWRGRGVGGRKAEDGKPTEEDRGRRMQSRWLMANGVWLMAGCEWPWYN